MLDDGYWFWYEDGRDIRGGGNDAEPKNIDFVDKSKFDLVKFMPIIEGFVIWGF